MVGAVGGHDREAAILGNAKGIEGCRLDGSAEKRADHVAFVVGDEAESCRGFARAVAVAVFFDVEKLRLRVGEVGIEDPGAPFESKDGAVMLERLLADFEGGGSEDADFHGWLRCLVLLGPL